MRFIRGLEYFELTACKMLTQKVNILRSLNNIIFDRVCENYLFVLKLMWFLSSLNCHFFIIHALPFNTGAPVLKTHYYNYYYPLKHANTFLFFIDLFFFQLTYTYLYFVSHLSYFWCFLFFTKLIFNYF